jgi:mannosyltransferase
VQTAEQKRVETPEPVPARQGTARRRLTTVVGLLALTGFLAWLAAQMLGAWYWVDESMSIGIASHPISEIPTVLREDGTPPLFYVLLHVWIRLFGTGEQATASLSLIFALACVPAAFWLGSSLFSRRAGWYCAVLAATNGLIIRYSNETRMYALLGLLSILATGAFLHAFVFRRRGYVPMFSVLLCAMLYTHTWAVFFVAAAAIALIPCVVMAPDRRRFLLDALLAFGAAGVGFLPWVPNLLYQRAHTGAPWAALPSVKELYLRPIRLVGGWMPFLLLAPLGGLGVAEMLRRRRSRLTVAYGAAALLMLAFIVIAWVGSHLNPGWSPRYFIIIVAPTILVIAVALSRVGRWGLVALIAIGFLSARPAAPICASSAIRAFGVCTDAVHVFPDDKVGMAQLSNLKGAAHTIAPRLRPGDLVLSMEPGQLTTLYHYLPPGMRYATSMGVVRDPGVIDWRDVIDRLAQADVRRNVTELVDALPVGGHVVVATPNFIRETRLTRYFKLVNRNGRVLLETVTHDPRIVQLLVVPRAGTYPVGASSYLRVFERTS